MKCPAYVPEAVREYIAARLDGDAREPTGLRKAHAKSRSPDREAWAAEIACLERLILDARMQEVYATLGAVDITGEAIAAFIAAAWVAKQDYARVRSDAESTDQWCSDVAATARKLSKLLKSPPRSAQELPGELFYLRDLIERADHSPKHRDFDAWRNLRDSLLGKRAWEVAPDASRLVDVLAAAAASSKATPTRGLVGAALKSRQRNAKTAYLRAFIAAAHERGFDARRQHVAAAMAVAAAVVLNDPNLVVSRDDIRKAVKQLAA